MDVTPGKQAEEINGLSAIERQVVAVFVDGVKVLGMPRSIGEIYGLLYISSHPLALDDLAGRLGISKGSVSQGLRMLKELGAIREVELERERRTHYVAAIELKRLVGGFIREQIRPHLASGKTKIGALRQAAQLEPDPAEKEFLSERIERLDHWMRSGSRILPILQKLLGE